MNSTISIASLTRDYGQGKGVFDLSFEVKQGEAFGFLGPNGAGKTTAIRHLMGFLRPIKGRCEILGLDCWNKSAQIQRHLGYIPGEITLPNDMTGHEFLKFYEKYRGDHSTARRKALLERFELNLSGKIKKMSKGMKQKLGIVAAFQHDPAALILDEPTSGLDPLMQNRFIELILEEKSRGKTILMSSHMFEEVEKTCDRIGILKAGRMAAIESSEKLKAAQAKKYSVTFEDEESVKLFSGEGFNVEIMDSHSVNVVVTNDLNDFVAALSGYRLSKLSAPAQSLEEIFLSYYGEKEDKS